MKVNIPVRFKNPWFWVGVASVAITAIGVDPQTFTSWAAVWNGAVSVLSNPVQLVTMCLATSACRRPDHRRAVGQREGT